MHFPLGTSFQLQLSLPDDAVPLRMVWIAPGSFTMGSLPDERDLGITSAENPFQATLTQGFWLGRYLVTQAHWQAFKGFNPSRFRMDGLNRPVEQISWHRALACCECLNQQFAKHLPEDYQFSLPTEMQWEYACRAGTRMRYTNGNTTADLARSAWYAGNSHGQTQPVGQKEPNAWGLYDMLGNVLEWCYDLPSTYPAQAATDWVGTETCPSQLRAIRSCFYAMEDGACRISAREWVADTLHICTIGFRLCLRPQFVLEPTELRRQ